MSLTFFPLVKIHTVIFSLRLPLNNKPHVRRLVEDEAAVEMAFGESYLATLYWGTEFLGLSVTVLSVLFLVTWGHPFCSQSDLK